MIKKLSDKDEEKFISLTEQGNFYFMKKNKPEIATEYYKKALAIKQNNKTGVCLGVALLKTENFKNGWKYFEKRIDYKISSLSNNLSADFKPFWRGEEAKDKTILVYSEGGFGDTIMFSRFLPLLENRFKKVLFLPQKPLINLFRNSFENIEFLEQINLPELNFDFHLPIRSLPFALGLFDKKDIKKEKYLNADVQKMKNYKEKCFDNNLFKLGINWRGNDLEGGNRKISLENFLRKIDLPNIKIYSLQTAIEQDELTILNQRNITDLGSNFKDFNDTAAAVENLDLVITNDTSVANLIGALGKKGIVLLPYISDWRWGLKKSSVWYPTLKLIRQDLSENWEKVIDNIDFNFTKS